MSLEKIIKNISKQYEENPEKLKIEKTLEKLREKVRQLELIKNSLELKSGVQENGYTSGMGGIEYSQHVEKKSRESNEDLTKLIDDNRKVLLDLYGINDEKDFINSKDLASDANMGSEVKKYTDEYKTIEENKSLKEESDQSLIKKLQSMDIQIDGEFSYENILKTINEYLYGLINDIKSEELKLKKDSLKKGSEVKLQYTNDVNEMLEKDKKEKEGEIEFINNFISLLDNIEKELPPDKEVYYDGVTGLEILFKREFLDERNLAIDEEIKAKNVYSQNEYLFKKGEIDDKKLKEFDYLYQQKHKIADEKRDQYTHYCELERQISSLFQNKYSNNVYRLLITKDSDFKKRATPGEVFSKLKSKLRSRLTDLSE